MSAVGGATRLLLASIILLALDAPAAAQSTTLPVNRFIVNLPSGWTVHRASGTSNQDILRSSSAVNLAVGWTNASCATFFSHFQSATGAPFDVATVSYVPSGWEVRSTGASYVACHATPVLTLAAQWWPLPTAEYNPEATWQGEVNYALGALDAMRKATGVAARGNLVTLPGTGVIAQIPDALRVATSDPDAGRDTLSTGSGNTVEVFKMPITCAATMAQVAGMTEVISTVTSWKLWQVDGLDAYCADVGDTARVVTSVPGDEAAKILLESMAGELFTESTQDEIKLGGTGYSVNLANGWTASAAAGVDTITTAAGAFTVTKKSGACAPTGAVYDPSWLGESNWTNTIDAAETTVTVCSVTSQRGTIEVSGPLAMFEGRYRRATDLFLSDLISSNQTVPPPPPHKGLLPIPLRLSFAAMSGDEAWSYGGRIATGWLLFNALGFHAELGYDTQTKLNYDFHLTIGIPSKRFSIYGAAGRDMVGSGVMPAAWYYGVGTRAGVFSEDGDAWLYLEAEYLWRRAGDPAPNPDPTMPPLDVLVDNEVRVRADLFYYKGFKNGWLPGGTLEYRNLDGHTLLLGLYTRL